MVSAKLTIYSQDGQKITSNMSFYIGTKKSDSSVAPTKQDINTYVAEYISTSKANNNCLISPEESSKGIKYGVLRSRIGATGGPSSTQGGSISESFNPPETPLDAVIRGLKEELGCVVDKKFFHLMGVNNYALVVDVNAKQKIINTYKRLLPLTELYDVAWSPLSTGETVPNVQQIVTDNDITEYDLIQYIDSAKALPNLPPPLTTVSIPTNTPIYNRAAYGGKKTKRRKLLKTHRKTPKLFTQRKK